MSRVEPELWCDAAFSNGQRTPNFGKSDSSETCRIFSDMRTALAYGKVKPRLTLGGTEVQTGFDLGFR